MKIPDVIKNATPYLLVTVVLSVAFTCLESFLIKENSYFPRVNDSLWTRAAHFNPPQS